MASDQNLGNTNDEPAEDGLSALRRLTALDHAGVGASHQDRSSQTADVVETIPDWLELLLAKYGEQASKLIGIESDPSGRLQPRDLADSRPASKEASEVASLLEQMAAEEELGPPSGQLATSVDWGRPGEPEDEMEDQAPDWLELVAKPSTPPPVAPAIEEETPDWLSDISQMKSEAESPAEPAEGVGSLAGAEDVPDWLRDLGVVAPDVEAQQVQEMQPAPVDEVPDWLKGLGITAPESEDALPARQVPESPPGVEDAEGEVPEWLREMEAHVASSEPSPLELAAEVPAAEPEEEVPDRRRELGATEGVPAGVAPPVEPLPSPPELAAEAFAEPEEEVPDWLRELGATEGVPADVASPVEPPPSPSERAAQESAVPEEEVPDWLRELGAREEVLAAEPPSVEPPPSPPLELAPEAPAEPEVEVPDWLASLRDEEPSLLEVMAEEEIPPEEHPPGEMVEEPDWLAELRTTGKPHVLVLDEEVVEAEEEALPDWLAELKSSQAAAEMSPAGPEVFEEMPQDIEAEKEVALVEYLPAEVEAEMTEAEETGPPLVAEGYLADEEGGALDWLAEIEAAAAAPEHTEGEIPSAEVVAPPVPEETPDWLRQMPPDDLIMEGEIPESKKETVEMRRPPGWLAGLGEEEGDVSLSAEEAREIEGAPPVAERAAPAEKIPDWLLVSKPIEEKPPESREEEPYETEGVLAGIPGLLPIIEEEPEGEEEPIAALRSRMAVPEVPDVEGAKLFREIATERPAEHLQEGGEKGEIAAALERGSRRRSIVGTLAWALIFTILILAIALALMAVLDKVGDSLGGPVFREFFGSPLVIDPAPVNTFRAQVTRLPPDAVVVVSFDYNPATEAEMGPLAQIILGDLLENQARVIAVSLRPEGATMAQRLFERFESDYPYGQRTINLGYLPGQTAGVRSLAFLASAPLFQNGAQTLRDYPAWQDVDGLGDVALIVAVADSPLAVRWWVEQVGPGTLANRPMVAAVSAAADPTVRPYYNQIDPRSGQLLGLLSGVTGAAAYENRLRQPGRAMQSLAAQSVAHLGLVVLSLGGTVAGFRTQATKE